MLPITVPADQADPDFVDVFFRGMVIGPLQMPTLDCDCPAIEWKSLEGMRAAYELSQNIDAALRRRDRLPPLPRSSTPPEEDLHYVFIGTLTAEQVTGKTPRECDPEYPEDCWGGNLEGTFTFHVKLMDQHHGQTLNEGSVSWTGHIWCDVGNRVEELSKSLFLPLDQLIRDHERTPESARVEVPNDTAQAGETTEIKVSELRNEEGQPTQDWQRIVVKVEKGTILNAEAQHEGYYVFKVGTDPAVTVQYRAPDACKPDTETLTVFNTCEMRNKVEKRKKKEIKKKEFDIVCDQWDVTITYSEDVGGTYQETEEHKKTVQRNYSATFKARVKFVEGDGRTATYESEDAEVQIQDNYNHHSVLDNGECAWRGGFNGSKSGRVPVEVKFRLNTHNHTYHVGLGKWSGDGITYTLGGNIFGSLEGCSGAWQKEVTSVDRPRGWEKGEGPPESRTWAPGQTSFTFQNSWDDYATGVWPDCLPPPVNLKGLAEICYGLTYVPFVFDWGHTPQMKIKKSLSWEVTRPK